jgi:hypothetical protein
MKIVKQFDDYEFYKHQKHLPKDGFWKWGLGDDGNLYFMCSELLEIYGDEWIEYDGDEYSIHIRFNDMLKIVKEFGHLLVFT